MAKIVFTAITPVDADGRPVFNTQLNTVGLKGDDYLCGHCGRQMLTTFDVSKMRTDMVYQCGVCEGYNEPPKKK